MDEVEGSESGKFVLANEVQKVHLSKRARYNKTAVVVFDNADRKEYLTGFRKRKNKRRQVAEEQRLLKERAKRIQDRRERRLALKQAKGEPVEVDEKSKIVKDAESQEGEELDEESTDAVTGTVTYDDKETMTVVTTTPIVPDEDDDPKQLRNRSSFLGKRKSDPAADVKPKKVKYKKPKIQSEKRMRKLTRREKSVPRNLRPKKKGRKR